MSNETFTGEEPADQGGRYLRWYVFNTLGVGGTVPTPVQSRTVEGAANLWLKEVTKVLGPIEVCAQGRRPVLLWTTDLDKYGRAPGHHSVYILRCTDVSELPLLLQVAAAMEVTHGCARYGRLLHKLCEQLKKAEEKAEHTVVNGVRYNPPEYLLVRGRASRAFEYYYWHRHNRYVGAAEGASDG